MPRKNHIKSYCAKIVSLLLPIITLTIVLAAMRLSLSSTQALTEQTPKHRPDNANVPLRPSTPLTLTESQKLIAHDADADDRFGYDIALGKNTLIIGSPQDDDGGMDAGAVYIYYRDQVNSNWEFVTKLIASDSAIDQRFGNYVDVEGDTLVVGANENGLEGEGDIPNEGPGSAYVFYRNQGGPDNWGEVRKLVANDGAVSDRFGESVAVYGDIIVVGAHHDNHSGLSEPGSAYIFERDWGGPDNWGQVVKITAFDPANYDLFGRDVGVMGDLVAVGARWDSHAFFQSGSVYLFGRDQGGPNNWGLVKKIVANDPGNTDRFGRSMVFSGDRLAVSSHLDNDGGTDSGSVYVFQQDQGGPGNWGQVAKFTAKDVGQNFQLSRSLHMHSNLLIAGARYGDTNISNSGTSYIFQGDENNPQSWTEVAKLAASDASMEDQFGFDVAIYGTTAVVSAYLEDSGGNAAGAVYIYEPRINLTKTVVPDMAEPGDAVTYTIQLVNTGYLTASNIVLTDVLPIDITNVSYSVSNGLFITPTGVISYVWNVADIPPGEGGIITMTGIVSDGLSSEVVITNTAVLSTSSPGFVLTTDTAILEVNVPPQLGIDSFYDINESEGITLTGIITDPGMLDSFTLDIDWGDGLSETIIYSPGTASFQQFHFYPDDDPSGTSADDYIVHLSLSDSDGGLDEEEVVVTVHNITPTVSIGPDVESSPGDVITFTGTFTDPGLLDTFSYEWDLGDGTTTTGTLAFTHTYAESGNYEVTLTVRDDDAGVGQDMLRVQVGSPQLFIPFVVSNDCSTQFNPVDVVLAIDASNSMAAAIQPGNVTKIEAAQAAAITFLDFLPFPNSQAAVVSFNEEAILEHPLDTDPLALMAAVQSLTLSTLTRIDLALTISRSEILGPRHQPGYETVLILLTDGVPAGTTETEVLSEASATKAAGITIYTIGLGEDVDTELLRAVANSSDLYYEAPSASDLTDIYAQIADVIQCGG